MKEPDGESGWHIGIDISGYQVCTNLVGEWLHRTGAPTNGQNAGDLMPNAGRREKDPKCGSLLLNAGELAALLLVSLDLVAVLIRHVNSCK